MSLEKELPILYKHLIEIKEILENYYMDVCDLDFVIEKGKLYIIGVKVAKRSLYANVRFALDFFKEGKIDINEMFSRLIPSDIESLISSREITNPDDLTFLGHGLPASAGIRTGIIAFTKSQYCGFLKNRLPIILVKKEISPDDLPLIQKAEGVLTLTGGMTSHAAVVCREMGKACVSGFFGQITTEQLKCESTIIRVGEFITIDGSQGKVYKGKANLLVNDWKKRPEITDISKLIEYLLLSNLLSKANIGACWAIRDLLLHGISTKNFYTAKQPIPHINKYFSFKQPERETINSYWKSVSNISKEEHKNYKLILMGIRNTLHRILSNKIGIGNHYKWYRPLIDPMKSIKTGSRDFCNQLIVEEYFDINRYIPYLIDIYRIKISVVIQASEKQLWFLDTTNINGESIIERGGEIIAYRLVVNDTEVSYCNLPGFYNAFRKREYFLSRIDKNGTDFEEIVSFLGMDEEKRFANHRLKLLSNDLGLLDGNELTNAGKSVIGILTRRSNE